MRANNSWLVVVATTAIAVQDGHTAVADTVKWLLHDFRRPAADRADFEKAHRAATYDNRATICPEVTLKVSTAGADSGGYASIQVTKSKSHRENCDFCEMTTVTSCAGLLFPIDRWWRSHNDLRQLRELRFKSRGRIQVNVTMDGPAVPRSAEGINPVAWASNSGTAWEWNTVDLLSDAGYPYWVERFIERNSPLYSSRFMNIESKDSPDYDLDTVNILKNVRAIKFELSNTDQSFQIDSILLVGVAPTWPRVAGKSCQGASTLLDDFAAAKPNPSVNLLGGSWWAVSDTSFYRPQSPATGKSSIRSKDGAWAPDPELAAASLVAELDRIDPDAHPDAGWASLFTRLPWEGLPNLKAISMKFATGGESPFSFDSTRVVGVVFRAHGYGFADSLIYEALIPYRQIRSTPEDSSICLDLSELRQPAWYTGLHGIKPVSPKDIQRFSWSLVLQDPAATTASTSRVDLKEVRLWGLEPTSSVQAAGLGRQEVGIRNHDGIRLSYSVPGARAQIRIVGMDGTIASSFTAPATVSDMALPHKLGRGTYAIEILGSGERRKAKFTVP